MIVLVTDGLIDAEVDVDIDKLLDNDGDVLLEVEVDGDIDDDVEELAEGLGVTEWETVVLGVNDDVLVWLDAACIQAVKRMTKIKNS